MLIDELKALATKADVKGCKVAVWLSEQDTELSDVIDVLKQKSNLNYSAALDLIKRYHPDLPFKRTSFVFHIKGTCSCQTA